MSMWKRYLEYGRKGPVGDHALHELFLREFRFAFKEEWAGTPYK